MYFTEEDYNRVEKATLNGLNFNSKQREFIELMDSKYVIAGPGAGKTTSLSAKIVLLLLSLIKKDSNDGICIITKTNVAVEEINRILKNVGQSSLKHPHFVGTIHNFFNTYLATPYIQKELNPKQIRFRKEDEFIPILKDLARRHSYFSKWNEEPRNATVSRINRSKLRFNTASNSFELENSTEWENFEQHRRHMFTLKWSLKKIGCFSFDDTFLFSKAALTNEKIISLLRKRFKYIFIDEFQDTEKSSLELINRIFNHEGNIVQYIGDPYQTLNFEGEMPFVDLNRKFELNICNRFGHQLAKQLSAIVSDVDLVCPEEKNSFDPVLFIYENKEKLIDEYKKYFEKYNDDQNFVNDTRRNTILGIQNNTIDDFMSLSDNPFGLNKKKNMGSCTRQILNVLQDVVIDRIPAVMQNEIKVDEWLKDHPLIKSMKICLIRSIRAKSLEVENLLGYLNKIVNEKGGKSLTKNNNVFSKISKIIEQANTVSNSNTTIGSKDFEFCTIHSVKGETHRSVLLIDSEKDAKPKIHTKLLKAYFCDWEVDLADDWVERNLLYVAMSRPSYLFSFAMDRNFITNQEIEIFKAKGWEVVFAKEE